MTNESDNKNKATEGAHEDNARKENARKNEQIYGSINNIIRSAKNIVVLSGAGTSATCFAIAGTMINSVNATLNNTTHQLEKDDDGKETEIEFKCESLELAIKGIDFSKKYKVLMPKTTDNGDKEDEGLEEYLGRLETMHQYFEVMNDKGKNTGNNDVEMSEIINKIKTAIKRDVIDHLREIRDDKLGDHERFLQKLAIRQTADLGRLRVFTTNYDLMFEKAAQKNKMVVVDGFSYLGKREFDPNYFDYDIMDNQRSRRNHTPERIDNLFYLYKVHGSINWFAEGEIAEGCKTKQIFCHSDAIEGANAIIITPGIQKYQDSYNSPYLEMITRLQTSLLESEMLIITGYSFGDEHINSIISACATRNTKMLILVCKNPRNKDKKKDEKGHNLSYNAGLISPNIGVENDENLGKNKIFDFVKQNVVIVETSFKHFANEILKNPFNFRLTNDGK